MLLWSAARRSSTCQTGLSRFPGSGTGSSGGLTNGVILLFTFFLFLQRPCAGLKFPPSFPNGKGTGVIQAEPGCSVLGGSFCFGSAHTVFLLFFQLNQRLRELCSQFSIAAEI